LGLKLLIERSNLAIKSLGERRFHDPRANLLAARSERVYVVAIEAFQLLGDAPLKIVGGQELAKGFGGGGKAARHADARARQGAGHLTEGSVLAADLRQVGEPQVFQPR